MKNRDRKNNIAKRVKKNDDYSSKITEISNAKNRHFWVIFDPFFSPLLDPPLYSESHILPPLFESKKGPTEAGADSGGHPSPFFGAERTGRERTLGYSSLSTSLYIKSHG